ncbi:MAG TPA: hemolysin family protein [Geminicoccaceae bacterium]|nr:hemolysin family protein [Geminicoccaceae bacterium]
MLLTIIEIILLLAANAFFVAAEFAIVKVRGIRIEALAEQGNVVARMSLRILRNVEAYLSACQLGITMASLGLGWIGEPAVSALLTPLLRPLGLGETTVHTIAFMLGFLIFSSLHIVIGEQVPKTFAIRKAEPMALWIAYPLHVFYLLCFPLNWLLNRASRAILATFGVAEVSHHDVFSGEELRGLIDVSREHGMVLKTERDMLGGILDLADVEVSDIMTHRKDIVSIDVDAPPEEIFERIVSTPYTRYPLWRGDPDAIIGVLHAKDMLAQARNHPEDLAAIDVAGLATPPWFIPDTTALLHQLLAFRQRRSHLAFVVDEYGALMGLVTLEDILEEIVGEISDEKDIEIVGIEPQADGSVLVRGWVTLRDLNRHFGWKLPDHEAATIAGLLIYEAQKIPEAGQKFSFHGFHFEVLRRQQNQVVLLRIMPASTTEAA